MKKIYFAGAIRGGREKQQDYYTIIEYLKNKNNVLTEIIGDKNLSISGENLTDREIYLRDINYIELCDVVIAECSIASLGVGYELAYAEKLGKRIIVIFELCNDKKLSAMIGGNSEFEIVYYENVDQLIGSLSKMGL